MSLVIYHNILWSRYKGGVFSQLHEQASALGVDVAVVQIAETEGDRAVLSGVDLSYHRYPYTLLFKGSYGAPGAWARAKALVRDLRGRKPTLVVIPGFERAEFWALLAYCIVRRIPRAVFCDSTIHDRPRGGAKELAKRLFFSLCDGVFCYGVRAREYLMHYGVPASRIHYRVQAAALPHDYRADEVVRQQAARAPVPADGGRLLYVGRLSVEKGLPDLLDAFGRVLAKRPHARLSLVGAGPLKDALVARAGELGIAANVDFLGSRDTAELAALYLHHDVFVLPSHSEPWGLVVNEALAYGIPVVVSDVCGCVPELVGGTTGIAFPRGDVAALAQAIYAQLAAIANRAEMAQSCIERVSNNQPDVAARQILAGAERILGAPLR